MTFIQFKKKHLVWGEGERISYHTSFQRDPAGPSVRVDVWVTAEHTKVSPCWEWMVGLLSLQDNASFFFPFYGTGHICCRIMTRVSQMEHEECVCLCVRGCPCAFGKGELMSLLWAIIRTLAPHSAIIKGNISELPNGGPHHNTNSLGCSEWCSGRKLSAELFSEAVTYVVKMKSVV